MGLLVIVAALGVFLWLSARANELFCLSVRDGRLILVRGRIPPALRGDFEDIVNRPPMRRGTIKASRSANGASLSVSGCEDGHQEQRLRNVFHLYPMSTLRAAPGPLDRERTLGQVLGIAWLAWLLQRSR